MQIIDLNDPFGGKIERKQFYLPHPVCHLEVVLLDLPRLVSIVNENEQMD